MSEITLNIRDAINSLHSQIHGSRVDYLVAALSADPETIAELQTALARYRPDEATDFFKRWQTGLETESWDAGVCVIDLAARLAVIQSTYSSPGPSGDVVVIDHKGRIEAIRYHLAEDWLFINEMNGWEKRARERRAARAATPPLDARPVLYDRVCEFIASACAAEPVVEESLVADRIREIHARWLTSPHDDLRGLAPRDVLLERRNHIDWELQDRGEQWTIQHAAPQVLSKASAAYRYAGFGTHEIVLYYDLVRFLLYECWDHVHSEAFRLSEKTLDMEAARLRGVRDSWLNSQDVEDLHGKTPAAVIEHERIRLPEAMSGTDAVIDHDCPLCQMMADSPAPMFWHLDGCNMDDDFAFSFDRTREEWDAERKKWEEFNREFNARHAAGEREADTPWLTSYVNTEALGDSPTLAIFAFATHLTELVQNLKDADAAVYTIDELNRRFGNVRDVVERSEFALVEPAIERLCETLLTISADHPPLGDKCCDLEQRVREFGHRVAVPSSTDDVE